jgi:L-asparaginase/Glu-tRNA(Gln) amidotransferase subunit D
MDAGTGVGAHQHVAFPEVVAEAQFECVIAIVTRVFEGKVAAGGAERIVDEAARAAFF